MANKNRTRGGSERGGMSLRAIFGALAAMGRAAAGRAFGAKEAGNPGNPAGSPNEAVSDVAERLSPPLSPKEIERQIQVDRATARAAAAKAERAKRWPQPDPGAPKWSKKEEQRVRQAVIEAFAKLEERKSGRGAAGAATAAIAALRLLASRAPARAGATHLHWIDAESKTRHFLEPLIAQAAVAGSQEVVAALLDMGANPDAKDHKGRSPMWHAMIGAQAAETNRTSRFPQKRAVSQAEKDAQAKTALESAERIVSQLLAAGAVADEASLGPLPDGYLPLLFGAASLASETLTRELIRFGARADLKSTFGTPILAVLAGDSPQSAPLFEALVKAGADFEDRYFGDTALLSAARWRNKEPARELLRLGARTDALSREGLDWRGLARKKDEEVDHGPKEGAFLAFVEKLEIQAAMAAAAAKSSAAIPPVSGPQTSTPIRNTPRRM